MHSDHRPCIFCFHQFSQEMVEHTLFEVEDFSTKTKIEVNLKKHNSTRRDDDCAVCCDCDMISNMYPPPTGVLASIGPRSTSFINDGSLIIWLVERKMKGLTRCPTQLVLLLLIEIYYCMRNWSYQNIEVKSLGRKKKEGSFLHEFEMNS